MTTATATAHRIDSRPSTEQPAARLRVVLGLNAATSLTAGIVAAFAGPWVADTMGLGSVAWTRIVGVALIVFAVDVALVARYSRATLRSATLAISAVDIAWVAATIVVVSAASLTTTGWIIAAVMAVGVADFAAVQLWFRRQLG